MPRLKKRRYYCSEVIEKLKFLESAYIIPSNRKNNLSFPIEGFKFSDGQDISAMPKPPEESDYWKRILHSKNYFHYKHDDMKIILEDRLYFIQNYFERFSQNRLARTELKKSYNQDFQGPYLPIPGEVEKISKLNISIDWQIPELQTSALSRRDKVSFNAQHFDHMVKNWVEFTKIYGVYDMRPLIGVRSCVVVLDEDGEHDFIFYRLLNSTQYRNFIHFMGKGLDNISYNRLKYQVMVMCDCFWEGKFTYRQFRPITGLELHLVEAIIEKFSDKYSVSQLMSILIGKKSPPLYENSLRHIFKYRNIPLYDGPWTEEEDLLLINNILKFTGEDDIAKVALGKYAIPWPKIFENIKVRHMNSITKRWACMKQHIINILKRRDHVLQNHWSDKHIIKLIEIIYRMNVQSIREIDWHFIASNFFPKFSDFNLKGKFDSLYKSKVPDSKYNYFSSAMEYLYHNLRPVLISTGEKHFNKRILKKHTESFNNLRSILRCSKNCREIITNFYSVNEDNLDDDDEELILHRNDGENHQIHTENEFDVVSQRSLRNSGYISYSPSSSSKKVFFHPEHVEEILVWQKLMDRSNMKSKMNLRDLVSDSESGLSETVCGGMQKDGHFIIKNKENSSEIPCRKIKSSRKNIKTNKRNSQHQVSSKIKKRKADISTKYDISLGNSIFSSKGNINSYSKKKKRKRGKKKILSSGELRKDRPLPTSDIFTKYDENLNCESLRSPGTSGIETKVKEYCNISKKKKKKLKVKCVYFKDEGILDVDFQNQNTAFSSKLQVSHISIPKNSKRVNNESHSSLHIKDINIVAKCRNAKKCKKKR